MPNQNSSTLSWQAPEFRHYPKNAGWYAALIGASVLVVAFFVIIQNDIFAAVSLGLIAILAIIFSRQTPRTVEIELNSKGVKFGSLSYPYKQIKYFWVVHNPRHQSLNFHTSALLNNIVILELNGQDPERVRGYLLQFLPEHSETQETFGQKVMHLFKF